MCQVSEPPAVIDRSVIIEALAEIQTRTPTYVLSACLELCREHELPSVDPPV
jgi:hypothetical protein